MAQEQVQKVEPVKPEPTQKKRPVTKAKPKKQEKPKPVVKPVEVAPPAPVTGCEQLNELLITIGLNAQEVEAALQIATRESSCNSLAVNASSGACNFFQEYPCGKWGGLSDTLGHLKGADVYAKTRYGGWLEALSFWQANHWW